MYCSLTSKSKICLSSIFSVSLPIPACQNSQSLDKVDVKPDGVLTWELKRIRKFRGSLQHGAEALTHAGMAKWQSGKPTASHMMPVPWHNVQRGVATIALGSMWCQT